MDIADVTADVHRFATLECRLCQLNQLVVPAGESCARDTAHSGWCYVTNSNGKTPAGSCPQAILFAPGTDKPGSRISLQCIKSSENASGAAPASDAGTSTASRH